MIPVRLTLFITLASAFIASGLYAQEAGVLGYWTEPGGSVIHIDHCGANVCATLVSISRGAPSRVDKNNSKESLRQRTLCGLRIGENFRLSGPNKAEGGTLYDPKSGKTYRGRMESRGNELNLRGYIGFAAFGRTETWTRTPSISTCAE